MVKRDREQPVCARRPSAAPIGKFWLLGKLPKVLQHNSQIVRHRKQERTAGEPVNIGDRYHPRTDTSSVVTVRFIHPNGTVLVEAETPSRGASPLPRPARHPRTRDELNPLNVVPRTARLDHSVHHGNAPTRSFTRIYGRCAGVAAHSGGEPTTKLVGHAQSRPWKATSPRSKQSFDSRPAQDASPLTTGPAATPSLAELRRR